MMETFIIIPKDDAQQRALKNFLETSHIPYQQEPYSDETDFLTSTEANKKRLDAALEAAKRGEGVKMNLDDIWK
jgi:hypothetical protein